MANADFGLYLSRRGLLPNEAFEYYRRCIHILPASFTTLWMEDHLQWEEIPTLECLTTLSFLAAAFPHFRLGSLVICHSYRNPALVAKMAANIQFLSGGRLILGIGAGWKEDEYNSYGYPFPGTRTRLEQLEEAILVILATWKSLSASFSGQYYRIQDVYCEPRPSPEIPLLIGGGGEQRTLKLVAKYANWWNCHSCTVEEYAHKGAILKKYCDGIGRDPTEIKLTYSATVGLVDNTLHILHPPQRHTPLKDYDCVINELQLFCESGVTHFILKFADLQALERFILDVTPAFNN